MCLRKQLISTCIALPAMCATAGANSWYDAMPVSRGFGDFAPGVVAAEGLWQLRREASGAEARTFTYSRRRADDTTAPVSTATKGVSHAVAVEPMPAPVQLLGLSLIGLGLVARRRSEWISGV